MKKFLALALLSLVVVSNASARHFGRCVEPCPRPCPAPAPRHTMHPMEPQPACYKMVRTERPAQKVCETSCHWVCPPDTIREDSDCE